MPNRLDGNPILVDTVMERGHQELLGHQAGSRYPVVVRTLVWKVPVQPDKLEIIDPVDGRVLFTATAGHSMRTSSEADAEGTLTYIVQEVWPDFRVSTLTGGGTVELHS
jgi:hypothetical protein